MNENERVIATRVGIHAANRAAEMTNGIIGMSPSTKGKIVEAAVDEAMNFVFGKKEEVNQCSKSPDLWWIRVKFDTNKDREYWYLSDALIPRDTRVIVDSPYTGYTTVTVIGHQIVCHNFPISYISNPKWIVGPIDDTEYKKKEAERKRVAAEQTAKQERAKLAAHYEQLVNRHEKLIAEYRSVANEINRLEEEHGFGK